MMADEDDDDIWYGKAKSGLIQTKEKADKTTKAFLNGIGSPKALGSLHAMVGMMGAM